MVFVVAHNLEAFARPSAIATYLCVSNNPLFGIIRIDGKVFQVL